MPGSGVIAAERPRVLIVDHEASAAALVRCLEEAGCKVQRAYTLGQARGLLRSVQYDVVVTEADLNDRLKDNLIREVTPVFRSTAVFVTVEEPNVELAVRVIRAGAADYMVKPYDAAALARRILGVLESNGRRAASFKPQMRSPAFALISEQLKRLAVSNVPVLFLGEMGVGKKTIAQYLHACSTRCAEPFVEVRCDDLAGSEGQRVLFGDALGSHRELEEERLLGALQRVGKGCLYLNRIEEMPISMQVRLLQSIDQGRARFGRANNDPGLRARVVSSTELSFEELRSRVDPDLLYTLGVVQIQLPPLRDRRDDLEAICEDLIDECAAELGCSSLPIDAEVMRAASSYSWPGNIRELRARIMRALSLSVSGRIAVSDLFPDANASVVFGVKKNATAVSRNLDEARGAAERDQIVKALTATDGKVGDAARKLGISRGTLWTKMKRLGVHQSVLRPAEMKSMRSSTGAQTGWASNIATERADG